MFFLKFLLFKFNPQKFCFNNFITWNDGFILFLITKTKNVPLIYSLSSSLETRCIKELNISSFFLLLEVITFPGNIFPPYWIQPINPGIMSSSDTFKQWSFELSISKSIFSIASAFIVLETSSISSSGSMAEVTWSVLVSQEEHLLWIVLLNYWCFKVVGTVPWEPRRGNISAPWEHLRNMFAVGTRSGNVSWECAVGTK